MNTESEILHFLEENLKESGDKKRNIEIILYYYGFRFSSWPTLDETGKHFDNITRERIRQILNQKFRKIVHLEGLPSIELIKNTIQTRAYWSQSELETALAMPAVFQNEFSVRGLLNLMDDLGVEHGYEIYTPDLKPATRSRIDQFEENFVIQKSELTNIRKLLTKASKLPGRCGVANLNYLEEESKDFREHGALIRDLIKYSEDAWVQKRGDEFWYLFENDGNTLINYSERIFSLVEECPLERLAVTYENALYARTHKYPYPPVEIIYDYLKSSVYLENNRGIVRFNGESTEPNEIEKDIAALLQNMEFVLFPEIRDHLLAKEYSRAHTLKAITSSPLVYVDKSRGRSHYRYSLVGTPNHPAYELVVDPQNRYLDYLRRLRKLAISGTDITVETTRRREQDILQEWLFDGKTQEDCAICGKRFSVNALVTAHKKRRADCNEAERLDPNIVMPVCVFGCDYLYEKRRIYVSDGRITDGLVDPGEQLEAECVSDLIGNVINEEWLQGPDSYFYSPEG